ncbi:MAG: hypothetical protein Q4C61_17715 [Lachnospiraceae bacterium]|nr:hypothetical protein [Lachnospiraceae bacterium]
MSYQTVSKKVYYHVMEGRRCIFADERNKRKLLDSVLDIQILEKWNIYAFCITDECAYFITEAVGEASILDGMRSVADSYLKRYREATWNHGRPGEGKLSPGKVKELRSLQDIAVYCRQIHRIPLEEGYVNRIRDYWWSSYITYMGNYDWGMVDCRALFLYFSADTETARRKMQHYHQE